MMAEQGDLVVRQTELRIGDGVGWRGHNSWWAEICGSRAVKMVIEGNDTLSESCDDAVNFMVIEMRERSLHQLHQRGMS